MKDPKELQKQAEEAAAAYSIKQDILDHDPCFGWAVTGAFQDGYLSGFSSRDAEVEQLREALELIVGFSEDEPGMWLIRIHGIAKEALSPNN